MDNESSWRNLGIVQTEPTPARLADGSFRNPCRPNQYKYDEKVPMDRSAFEMDKGKCNLLGGDLGPFNPYHLSRDWPMDRSVSHTARVNTKMMKVWVRFTGGQRKRRIEHPFLLMMISGGRVGNPNTLETCGTTHFHGSKLISLKKAGHVRVLDMSRKSYTWQRTNHKTLQFRYNHHIFTILKVIRS
ncbi:hypothetical protein L3Y34_013269 [Caenorhabditis briggsae]|uniref:Uncharacterized protein n=1 Tax=Caenorhabditis briggsae TaxID=6238 RepID=A0AAE8ZWG8_CAEBR|nr:hypothetical protein L3Y34_013269 [Caenorhabditis briggsae]